MNTIFLIFFAIALAVIIFSIALQKILKCPALVAGIIFAIGIIITFIIGNLILLAATLVYTFISYITALIICLINRFFDRDNNCCRRNRRCNDNSCECGNDNGFNQANTINGVIRIVDSNGNNSCNNNEIATRINVVPNTANNGRTGCICGRFRRR